MKAKKLLTLALGAALAVSLTVPAMAAGKTFPDVPGTWAESSITRWANAGVLEGDNTGEYKPSGPMTRAEFAAMLCKLMGYTEKAKNTYADVSPDAWYYDVILKVTAAGVMKGDGVNANPNAPVSREEAAVMLCRAMNLKGESKAVTKFDDSTAVASWAQEAVAALTERGMINGVGDNKFAPAQNIDRASAAKLLDNMIHTYITAPGEYKVDDPDAIVIVNAKAVTAPEGETAPAVTVTGTAADVVVAPGTDAAVQAEDLTAGAVTVQADAAVTVDKDSKVDDLTVAAPADVTVAGKVENATLADGALTVADGGKVDAVAVPETAADDVSVTVDKGASVGTVTADSPVAMENNGTVAKVEANADGVTIDGNAPQKIDTAEGVEAPTNSEGETVKEEPASSGSSSSGGGGSSPSTPAKKYKVSIGTFTGGKVTASPAEADEAGTEVTLTVTPNVQNGSTLPYILKAGSLKVTCGDEEVNVSDNKFTMNTEGTYTVTAEFVQPLKEAELFIVNDQTTFDHLAHFGYTEDGTEEGGHTNVSDLKTMQWIALGLVRDDAYNTKTITNGKLTANGAEAQYKDGSGTTLNSWPGAIGKCSMLYVDKNTREPNDGGHLNLEGSSYHFVVTFKFEGADYELSCDYTKDGVDTSNLVTVTFKNGTETVATFKGMPAAGAGATAEKFTTPAAPTKTGYTFTGWKTGTAEAVEAGKEVDFTTAATYEAQWTENTYTIAFNASDGTGSMDSMTGVKYSETKALTKNAFAKEGYTFQGWSKTQNGTTVDFKDGASVSKLSDQSNGSVTLYAVWKADTYAIKYDLNGGKAGTDAPTSYEFGKGATLVEPTKTGSEFLGWYTSDKEGGKPYATKVTEISSTQKGEVTLTALWADPLTAMELRGSGAAADVDKTPYTEKDGIFDYQAAYRNVGITFSKGTITVDMDKAQKYIATEPGATEVKYLIQKQGNTENKAIYCGVKYDSPAGANKVWFTFDKPETISITNDTKNVWELNKDEVYGGQSVMGGDIIDYYPCLTNEGKFPTGMSADKTTTSWDTYLVWLDNDNNVLSVSKVTITLELTNIPAEPSTDQGGTETTDPATSPAGGDTTPDEGGAETASVEEAPEVVEETPVEEAPVETSAPEEE